MIKKYKIFNFRLESSLNEIRVTVPENVPSALPFALIRKNPHVSREEWEWIQQLDPTNISGKLTEKTARPTQLQYMFHQQLGRAVSVLINDLNIDSKLVQSHRLFRLQVLQIHPDISFILVYFPNFLYL